MSLRKLHLDDLLFLDIETVPEHRAYSDLSAEKQALWADKTQYKRQDDYSPEAYYNRAGIWAEFGKIVCISVGYFTLKKNQRTFRLTSYQGEEKQVLVDFKNLLTRYFSKPKHLLCAHNGREFDFPYIARRLLIHGMELPKKLDLFGKKPWEVPYLDTLELWKFGDYKHYTSLKLLTTILNIDSPKDDIDGAQVREVYYEENDLDRIARYCEKDVLAVAQILLRLRQEPLLSPKEIVSV